MSMPTPALRYDEAMNSRTALVLLVLAGCGGPSAEQSPATSPSTTPTPTPTAAPAPTAPTPVASAAEPAPVAPSAPDTPTMTGTTIPLPGATAPVSIDIVAIDAARSHVWVPVGNTGSVDVFDIASGAFSRVDGFKSVEREVNGKVRTMGPSAVATGDKFMYVGNRATNEVCPVETATLKPGKCAKAANAIDVLVYVGSTHEVWVTMPKDQSIAIFDASKPAALALKTTIKLDGAPECFAVDSAHGLVFTNLEDKDGTLAIDAKTRTVKSTWSPGCAADGPRGVAFDAARGFVIVACTDHLQVLDAGHDGALLGKLDTGAGVDNIDLVDGKVYAAAGKAAKVTVAKLDDKGQLLLLATGATSEGVRNAVADTHGNVYAPDARAARFWVFGAPQVR